MKKTELMISNKGFLGLCLWEKDEIGLWTLIDSKAGYGTHKLGNKD